MAVVYSDRAHRNNQPLPFKESDDHEKPKLDRTVIVLNENNAA